MSKFAEKIEEEVTSWEGVTKRRGKFGTIEFRLGRYVLGKLPLAGLVDERTIIQRMRDAYERAQDRLDRGAGVTV
ncbi:MAG TPA: luciferase family protein [Solirubrobacteraceae bacterium]|nr:luciferase family protein [Solirubrobacteraceae bacterium]